jgi:hypothetical protein
MAQTDGYVGYIKRHVTAQESLDEGKPSMLALTAIRDWKAQAFLGSLPDTAEDVMEQGGNDNTRASKTAFRDRELPLWDSFAGPAVTVAAPRDHGSTVQAATS